MSVDLSAIGISAEAVEKAPVQEIKSRIWSSQVSKLVVKEAGVFKTKSGATMFKLVAENQDRDTYEEYFNTKYVAKKDDKDGKFKAGEEVENMSGVSILTGLVAATGIQDIGAKPGTFKAYKEENQEGMVLTGVIGKVALFGIREINDPNSQYPQSNEIGLITDLDGKNAKGEEVMEKFKALIEKTPVLERKLKEGSTPAAGPDKDAQEQVKNMKF